MDSAGVPIPAGVDALLLLLAAASPSAAYFDALMAVLGSVIGNYFLYSIARKGGRAYLDARTRSGRAAKFREWFQRYGLLTVFIPTVLPIPLPMKPFILTAGAMGVPAAAFLAVVAAARLVRYLGLAYLGMRLGAGSHAFLKAYGWRLLGIAALLFVVLYLAVRALEKRRLSSAT